MRSLAELLRSRRAEILTGWERAALGDSLLPPAKRSGPVLRAHIPKLLDSLAEALDETLDGDEALAGRNVAGALLPHSHAKERTANGDSISTVLHELVYLRAQIVEVAIEAFRAGDTDGRGVRFVHAALDECMCVIAVQMERAEASDRERFVAVLGHDLRTPLNAVKMAGSLLLSARFADEQRLLAQKIVRAADRMNRMIGDLLDFAALRSGTLTLERRACDLRSVCAEVIDELRLAHAGRVILFHSDGNCEGSWDAPRMAQVVANLIGNAITYSPAASPVTVRLHGNSSAVEIEVHNAGDPIPTELQAGMFLPFKRGQSRKSGGVGLGLFIAQEMVRAHGGRIVVRSMPAEGTTFVVDVPRTP